VGDVSDFVGAVNRDLKPEHQSELCINIFEEKDSRLPYLELFRYYLSKKEPMRQLILTLN
jgi:hypothetical protein